VQKKATPYKTLYPLVLTLFLVGSCSSASPQELKPASVTEDGQEVLALPEELISLEEECENLYAKWGQFENALDPINKLGLVDEEDFDQRRPFALKIIEIGGDIRSMTVISQELREISGEFGENIEEFGRSLDSPILDQNLVTKTGTAAYLSLGDAGAVCGWE
jgi:hypothetical protein